MYTSSNTSPDSARSADETTAVYAPGDNDNTTAESRLSLVRGNAPTAPANALIRSIASASPDDHESFAATCEAPRIILSRGDRIASATPNCTRPGPTARTSTTVPP